MTGAKSLADKPPGAWTARQCVQYMLAHVREGEFYIICPDNETSEDLDRLRIRWAADDLIERRPALSRYVPIQKWSSVLICEAKVAPGVQAVV